MANLIELDDPHPQLRNTMSPAPDKLFGVTKREFFALEVSGVFFALEVSGVDENNGDILYPGTLIQFIPGYRGDECLFKIRNFTNWLDKYKTTIYKCKKTDYIAISGELWPYLVAFKNDEHLLKLVENINKTEFDLDMLKLGSEVRIRRPPGNEDKYYEFVVAYNGLIKEITTTGYYVGLQLKNDRVPLTSDLKHLSQHYRFEGTGIVVQIDWIMLNLYTEEERQLEPQIVEYNEASSNVLSADINDSEAKNNNFKNCRDRSPIKLPKRISDLAKSEISNSSRNEQPKKRIETAAILKQNDPPPDPSGETEFKADGWIEISETEATLNERQISQVDFVENLLNMNSNDGKNNNENPGVLIFPINEQTKKTIETAAESKYRDQSIETTTNFNAAKTEIINNVDRVVKMSETQAVPYKHSTPSRYVQPNKAIDISTTPEHRVMSPEIPCGSSSNYGDVTISATRAIPDMPENHVASIYAINQQQKYTTEIGIISGQCDQKLEFACETTTKYNASKIGFINNADGAVQMSETRTVPNNHPIVSNDFDEHELNNNSHYCKSDNASLDVDLRSATSKHRDYSLVTPRDGSATYSADIYDVIKFNGALQRNEFGNRPDMLQTLPITNNEIYDVTALSINQYKKNITETDAVSEYSEQSPKTRYGITSDYDTEIQHATNADGAMRNKEKNKCGVCSITVEIGDGFILRKCKHSFCTDCICYHVDKCNSEELVRCPYKKGYQCHLSLNDAEIKDFKGVTIYNKIPENRVKIFDDNETLDVFDSVHEPDDRKSRVQPTNVQSKIQYETDSSLDQSLKNSCDPTLNYTAEIESVTNADGAVRNAEKTNCDYCHITVEIGHGIILRECLHSFCTKCIRLHVYRNSKCSEIRCPYKQDYVCEFDLQDVEIKDLGGEKIHNTIVKNRLKEYMATDPNARWCTNKDCENVWVSQRDPHQQNERCPKCTVSFCLICQKAHEPDGRHENKPIKTTWTGKIKNTLFSNQPERGVNCAICRRTNIPANKYVKLQNCQHTICTGCVMPMIKSQISSSPHAYCSFCKVYLSYYEAAKITEFEASSLCRNIIPKIQPEVAAPLEICFCRPPLGNCGITLQCNHTFCRTYIAGIVREQFNNKGYAVCPRCIHKIDKNIIRHLVPALFKEEIVEKCKICIDVVQFRLTNCQHGFCLKCIRKLIVDQVFDVNNMTVICTVCNVQVRNEDIARYGGQEIYAGYKLKLENEAINIKRSGPHNKHY